MKFVDNDLPDEELPLPDLTETYVNPITGEVIHEGDYSEKAMRYRAEYEKLFAEHMRGTTDTDPKAPSDLSK